MFEVRLPIGSLFQGPTLEEQAVLVETDPALAAFDRIGLCHIPVGTGSSERLLRAVAALHPDAVVLTPSYAAYVLEQARRLGTSEADLLRAYPTLRAQDLANAWAYVRTHRDEMEEQICANEEA